MKHLNSTLLMNLITSYVNTYEAWRSDYEIYVRKMKNYGRKPDTWKEWGGGSLIEVEKDENGSWIEVE